MHSPLLLLCLFTFTFYILSSGTTMPTDPIVTRSKSASSPPIFDFATEFENFLSDPKQQALIQRVFCGPLLEEIRGLKNDLGEKNSKILRLETTVAKLEEEIDAMEQYTRRNSIRISGILEEQDECCEEKVIHVLNTRMGVSPPISADHIDRLHRLGKLNPGVNKPRQIIVKFTSYRYRSQVMAKRSALKGTQMFINEDLTRKRNKVMWHCRQEKKVGKLRDCWTNDGRILVRDRNGQVHQVSSLDSLYMLTAPNELRNQPSQPSNQP